MVAMPGRLTQQWSNEAFRRSATIALRLWNRAVFSETKLDQQNAVKALLELWTPTHASRLGEKTGGSNFAETVDQLLDFPSHRLAVYGSLAPGKKNHHMMAGMEGTWRKAVLRGSLLDRGWGAGQGFPGFVWDGTDSAVAAQVFTSNDLSQQWQRLDQFEGQEYRRVLVPVEVEEDGIEVCNVYQLNDSPKLPGY